MVICVKFCSKLGKTFLETFGMLKQASGDEAMNRTQTHEWYKHFKEGQTSIKNNEHTRNPLPSKNKENIQKVQK
jgi:hypothetical protein